MTSKSLKVAIQMDPLDGINILADSTFALAIEAQERGCELFHYLATDLSLTDGVVSAHARPLTVRNIEGDHYTLGAWHKMDLSTMDVILMRQDPPFHMGYITATHFLEKIHPKTLVVNDPSEVRNAPEKIYLTKYIDLMPPTLITRSKKDVLAFRAEHKDIIIKPLYGNGGAGIFRIRPDDENLNVVLETFDAMNPEPYIVQKYLSDIRKGDKRIILVDGVAKGALNRVPSVGEARSNLHVGGKAEQSFLTEREKEICDRIGPDLKARGLIFVGIDVIGDYLTEINVTSPTGIQEISRFDGTNLAGDIWDAIEARL